MVVPALKKNALRAEFERWWNTEGWQLGSGKGGLNVGDAWLTWRACARILEHASHPPPD